MKGKKIICMLMIPSQCHSSFIFYVNNENIGEICAYDVQYTGKSVGSLHSILLSTEETNIVNMKFWFMNDVTLLCPFPYRKLPISSPFRMQLYQITPPSITKSYSL